MMFQVQEIMNQIWVQQKIKLFPTKWDQGNKELNMCPKINKTYQDQGDMRIMISLAKIASNTL